MLRLPGPYRGLRIGLFGGSFNPAHEGHLHVAETALKRLDLDWVWWIVARGNPLKSTHGDYEARLSSARKVATHPRMRVSDIEAHLGLTYTVDVLEALLSRAIGAEFVWLMGADAAAEFHLWKDWQTIMSRIPVAVVSRSHTGTDGHQSRLEKTYAEARYSSDMAALLPGAPPPAWVWLNAPLCPASSTSIRNKSTPSTGKR